MGIKNVIAIRGSGGQVQGGENSMSVEEKVVPLKAVIILWAFFFPQNTISLKRKRGVTKAAVKGSWVSPQPLGQAVALSALKNSENLLFNGK